MGDGNWSVMETFGLLQEPRARLSRNPARAATFGIQVPLLWPHPFPDQAGYDGSRSTLAILRSYEQACHVPWQN